MVNLVAAQKPLLHGLMKLAGLRPTTVEVVPGTKMDFWVPSETIRKDGHKQEEKLESKKPIKKKPVVVLVHGFAAEGIVTWQFQVGSLTKEYSVYVPDLLFFGGSVTDSTERSPMFQAECLVKSLGQLGVDKCTVVGFSYGGMVAFKMAEKYPDLVHALVISGSILNMTDSISSSNLGKLGVTSSTELLLPTSVKGLKTLLSLAVHKKLWFPDRLHRDYLEVMFTNRKERGELLEALIISNRPDEVFPTFTQNIHLLWGEEDLIFNIEFANNMKEKLGDKATMESITKGGHLVHLERPCVYNRKLKKFLASLQIEGAQK
ncbi:alpha/beta-Hydrolases superfamily protein [Thalictrum thalictroides]|uniref:Alpha/beta-Hydrolases superfamily protein n=1 Tax=Thalictrum thalictroides TaxID=46969 RepID=A0A7J6WCZ0_THATH|nr:alpha/beta-Hydrolases superfamily protein [Thalictrum thalictroides]